MVPRSGMSYAQGGMCCSIAAVHCVTSEKPQVWGTLLFYNGLQSNLPDSCPEDNIILVTLQSEKTCILLWGKNLLLTSTNVLGKMIFSRLSKGRQCLYSQGLQKLSWPIRIVFQQYHKLKWPSHVPRVSKYQDQTQIIWQQSHNFFKWNSNTKAIIQY